MIILPKQLQDERFRFIKISMFGEFSRKKPLETGWQTTNNYAYTDKQFNDWLEQNNNYGVATGFGGLAVIDADRLEIAEIVARKLPRTFTVKTGSGGYHFYYIINDLDKKIILKDKDNNHYGEIQFKGQQVIGPNSIHPNGKIYQVISSSSIVSVSKDDVIRILSEYIKIDDNVHEYYNDCNYDIIDMLKFVNTDKMHKIGDEFRGPHPIHGSTTGMNFSMNPRKGVWHCFRCNTGGGPISLLAIIEGIIDCADYRPGCLTKETYNKLIEIARTKYNIVIKKNCGQNI